MIAVVGKIKVQPDKAAAFERIFVDLQATVKAKEPGCLMYRMTKSRDEPNTYRNVELFKDQAALDAHTSAEYFLAAMPGIGACLAGEPEIEFLDTID
jgi:quinol monooxygenase YgiN